MKKQPLVSLAFAAVFALFMSASGSAADRSYFVLASTTSVENSGLLAHVLPLFTRESGVSVRVVALGTGQALDTARRGDADLVLVHDPEAEAKFISEGHGINRREVAWNDFVIVGPTADPAKINGKRDILVGLRAIWSTNAPFVSRGDQSGTDALEKRLWNAADLDIGKAGPWYKDIGGSMGAALNAAAALDAYTLTDRGTWLSFGNRQNIVVLLEGDGRLINRYNVIELNPRLHPQIKQDLATKFADWLVSSKGQSAIGNYELAGQRPFHPVSDPKP